MSHLAALDHHMVDAARGEAMAHGEAGMTGPDHDGRRLHDGGQLTSTVTFVGLVRISYTAERFCDWATSASISAGVASASIS